MKAFLYKAKRSLFSCVLLTVSIGFTYAFSLFAPHVSELLGVSKTAVQFAFCLNIFFLGTGASCFGALVEKNIKKAAWLSTALLFAGLCLSGIAMHCGSLWLFYAGMGVLAGLAEGVGYVTPVKNLLLFFGRSKHKALIMAISIVSFGLGSSVCSFLFKYAFPAFGIENVFFFFAATYLLMMSAASVMIDKPRYAKLKISREKTKKYSIAKYVKDSYFWQCWLFMLLNISAGLVIIGQCAGMLTANGLSNGTVLAVMTLCGLSNGFGRILFPAISDYMRNRLDLLLAILAIEIGIFLISPAAAWFIPVAFVVCNATYGSFFALLPSVLNDHYGKDELSFVHGLALQSWATSSLVAFVVSAFILSVLNLSQNALFITLSGIYLLNFINVLVLKRRG